MSGSDIYWDGVDKLREGLSKEEEVNSSLSDMLTMKCQWGIQETM